MKNVKKLQEKRKGSMQLIGKSYGTDSNTKLSFHFLPVYTVDGQDHDKPQKKKEKMSNSAKRYFRPQSFHHNMK